MAKKNKSQFLRTKKEVKQTIPKKTFDRLAGKGKQFSKNQKERIGRELVKKMVSRTEEGLDINEEEFAKYGSGSSRSEKGKLDYLRKKERILGKKISPSDVDLTLYKKLLKSIKVKVTDDGDVEIKHKGRLNNLKAFAHTAGRGERPKGVPKRDYFGVVSDDIKETAESFTARDSDGEEE